MIKTKESPKKLMLAMALILSATISMLLSGTTSHAADSDETVVKNGLYYTYLSETAFKEHFTTDKKKVTYNTQYLESSKYNIVLSQIQTYGGIYVSQSEYDGDSSSISIENTINGKPVMIVNGYPSVKVINIPASVVSLPEHGYTSTSCTAINVASSNNYFTSVNGVVYNKKKTTLVCYPTGKKDKTYKMPKTVTKIYDSVLLNQKYIEKLIISDKVTTIPSYFGCAMAKLKSVHLPNKLKTLDRYAFEDCNKLKSVTIPATCRVNSRAFYDCKSLKTVTVKSKKLTFYMDIGSTINYTLVLKKGATITCEVNSYEGMISKQSNILSVKKKKDYLYTMKALETGNATITWGSQKIKVKVVE